jgi:putative RecB family exonuclease
MKSAVNCAFLKREPMQTPTLQELRKKPHLSASSVNSYIDCSLSYKFSKIDFIPQEFVSDAMIFGSCIHKALEFFHKERAQNNNNRLPLSQLHETFENVWRFEAAENTRIQYKAGNSYENLLNLGKSLLTTYYNNLPDENYKVIGVEVPFSLNIEGLPIPIIGAVDLIEEDESGTIIITDFKTAAKAYSSTDIDNSFQLTIYNLAFKTNNFSDREIILKFDCLIKTKVAKFEQYYTIRTATEEKMAIKKIMAVYDGICKGVFIPNNNSWKCSGCAYTKECQEWLLN